MVVISLRYRFRQDFRVPAKEAFAWCTDFGPEDGPLFPERHLRTAKRIAEDAFILTDTTFPKGSPLRIRRLVRMDPVGLAWTNTHLDGPYRHSQYWYRIVPDGSKASHLEFEGLRLVTVPARKSPKEIARLVAEQREGDSTLWRASLAPTLESEVGR